MEHRSKQHTSIIFVLTFQDRAQSLLPEFSLY